MKVSSRSIYGSGTPTDLSRVNASKPKREYALRSGSMPQGRVTTPEQDKERELAKLRLAQVHLMRRLERERDEEARQRTEETLRKYNNTVAYN